MDIDYRKVRAESGKPVRKLLQDSKLQEMVTWIGAVKEEVMKMVRLGIFFLM